jgi:hypothetical protein
MLKPGDILTCKPDDYIGVFKPEQHKSSGDSYISWLVITKYPTFPDCVKAESEVIFYLGSKNQQCMIFTPQGESIAYEKSDSSGVKTHEVLWRGEIYRTRTVTMKRLIRIKSDKICTGGFPRPLQ